MVKLPTLLVSAALPDDSRRRQSYCAGLWRRVIAPAGIDTIGADVGQFFPRQNSSLFTFTLVHLGNLDPVEHSLKSTLHTISFPHTFLSTHPLRDCVPTSHLEPLAESNRCVPTLIREPHRALTVKHQANLHCLLFWTGLSDKRDLMKLTIGGSLREFQPLPLYLAALRRRRRFTLRFGDDCLSGLSAMARSARQVTVAEQLRLEKSPT